MDAVKSTQQAELVKVNLRKHPNADKLSLIDIYGYTYVGQTEKWEGVEYGVWFPPDTLVDTTRPEFSELVPDAKFNPDSTKGGVYARIKAKKLRGIVSYGYMVPAGYWDDKRPISGEELFNKHGCAHYEPPLLATSGKGGFLTGGEVGKAPSIYAVKYDVDSFLRYAKEVFIDKEPVFVTEKIHGANGRWVFHNGEFYCGSRTEWKKEFATPPDPAEIEARMREKLAGKMTQEEIDSRVEAMKAKHNNVSSEGAQNMWWKALRQYPEMMKWLEAHPDTILYGEVYGSVQNMKYGTQPGEVRIAIFDIMKDGKWLDATEANLSELPWVPILMSNVEFDFDQLVALAEGPSLIPGANHFREGIVVKPMKERRHESIGRVCLKIISPSYYEMKG